MRKALESFFKRRPGTARGAGLGAIAALSALGLFSLSAAQEAGKIRIETELVNVDVVVKDNAGKRVPDLKKEDFEIYEDGVRQEITHFKPMDQPLRLVLSFDMSVSMGAFFPAIKDEAVKLVDSLNQLDEIMIASFGRDLQWGADWAGKARARTEILDLEPASVPWRHPQQQPFPLPPGRRAGLPDVNTNLYGAMHGVFERFGARGGNEVTLLFSDGVDSVDRNVASERLIKDSKQVIKEAQESWTQIYAACFKTQRENAWNAIPIGGRGKSGYGSNCKFLSEVASATGGRAFEFESQPELALVLKKTLDDLRSQYSLAYYPSSQGTRVGFHKIKVVVKRPDATPRAREGYLISK